MPVIPITQLDDPRLDVYRSLKQTNHTRWRQIFIAEGEKLVERLLDSPFETVSILAAETHVERLLSRVPEGVPVYSMSANDVDQLVGFQFHRGVLACGKRPANPSFHALWPSLEQPLTLVLCPDIKDPENLGTILRISAAFGVDGVIVGNEGTDPYSRRVLRVSMGTVFRLPVIQTDAWPAMLATLKQAGVETAATVLDPPSKSEGLPEGKTTNVESAPTVLNVLAERLITAVRPRRFALALGSEGHGLTPEFVALCDRRVTIPMADGVDSLNVAIAAGIFLHHFRGR